MREGVIGAFAQGAFATKPSTSRAEGKRDIQDSGSLLVSGQIVGEPDRRCFPLRPVNQRQDDGLRRPMQQHECPGSHLADRG